MALLDSLGATSNSGNNPNDRVPQAGRSSNNGNRQDRPKAQLWLNVGYQVGSTFVSLPMGIAIDNMDDAPVRGSDEDFIKLRHAQNALLAALKAKGMELDGGGEVEVNLTLKLRRVADPVKVGENELLDDFSTLFTEVAK